MIENDLYMNTRVHHLPDNYKCQKEHHLQELCLQANLKLKIQIH
jgi:hypothetical protein